MENIYLVYSPEQGSSLRCETVDFTFNCIFLWMSFIVWVRGIRRMFKMVGVFPNKSGSARCVPEANIYNIQRPTDVNLPKGAAMISNPIGIILFSWIPRWAWVRRGELLFCSCSSSRLLLHDSLQLSASVSPETHLLVLCLTLEETRRGWQDFSRQVSQFVRSIAKAQSLD